MSSGDEELSATELSGGCLIGPILPTTGNDEEITEKKVIGPELPPGFGANESEEDDCYGPSLPPGKMEEENEKYIGPALPPGFSVAADEEFGPSFPSEEDEVGPLPPSTLDEEEQALEYAKRRLEIEAQKAEESKPVREEWLTKIPAKGPIAGLTARAFKRSKDTSEIDQSWEETPQTKRAMTQKSSAEGSGKKRQTHAEEFVDNRGESLIDTHMKARGASAAKLTTNSGERVPFNRDKDMGYCGKPASVEDVKKRAGELKSRFGSKEYL